MFLMAPTVQDTHRCYLLALPLELRFEIYNSLVREIIEISPSLGKQPCPLTSLLKALEHTHAKGDRKIWVAKRPDVKESSKIGIFSPSKTTFMLTHDKAYLDNKRSAERHFEYFCTEYQNDVEHITIKFKVLPVDHSDTHIFVSLRRLLQLQTTEIFYEVLKNKDGFEYSHTRFIDAAKDMTSAIVRLKFVVESSVWPSERDRRGLKIRALIPKGVEYYPKGIESTPTRTRYFPTEDRTWVIQIISLDLELENEGGDGLGGMQMLTKIEDTDVDTHVMSKDNVDDEEE